MKGMEEFRDKKGYIPTLQQYTPIDSDFVGYFSNGGRDKDMIFSEVAQVDGFIDMCELTYKTFLYSDEKLENFRKNNLV